MSALPTFDHIEEELSAMLSIPDEDLTDEQKLDLEQYLDELAGQEEDKIDRFCRFIRIETERAEAIKEESRRLARKAQTAQSRIDYIKARYLNIMQQHGVPELVARIRELEDAAEFEARVSAKMAEPWISSGGKPKCKHKGCIVPLLRQKLKLRDVERICAWCVIKDARLAVEREMIAEGKGPGKKEGENGVH